MPLANQLFDTRPAFATALSYFPECAPIVPLLRGAKDVEQQLEALQNEAAGDRPRLVIPRSKAATATADELRAAWEPFTANAGSYELSGGTLTIKAMVAKNVAAKGNYQTYSVKMEGNTLTLVQKATDGGPTITFKMTRLE